MPASAKIITKLRERRQIEADLRKILAAGSEREIRRQAQQLAALGSQVIPVIVGNLDQADARMLAAMGAVATYLDREEVTQALRRAVLQPQRTDQARLGAMTILERFLGQPIGDDLLDSLADPETVAISSLETVLEQAEGNPPALLGYIQGLDRQEPDVVIAVTRALRDLGSASTSSQQALQAIELLRMMAQDVRQEIAGEALRALGTVRLPEAARALQTLIPVSAPELRPLAERLLRKLRLSGVKMDAFPPPNPAWRALVSSVGGVGHQSVWFIQPDGMAVHARFLNILLNEWAGAVEAVAHQHVPELMLPPRRPVGHVHDVAMPDGSGEMLLLETTFDLGRRLVLDALERNRETQIPVAGSLRLYSPWLWDSLVDSSLLPRALPELSPEDADLAQVADCLLAHPAFASWSLRSDAVVQGAYESLRRPAWDVEVWVRRLAGELFADPMLVEVFSKRLLAMSEWLLLAGEEDEARLAAAAAQGLLGGNAADQPLVRALVRRDLDLIVQAVKEAPAEPGQGNW